MHYDVFNGDADGILALLQLRLAQPKNSELITGVKRDIALLKQVSIEQTSSVTVLDISMEKNSEALKSLLDEKIPVFYVDHHRTGEVPTSDYLEKIIDTDANTCTSLLVNEYLNGEYAHWAVVAAYGDNMNNSAETLADSLALSDAQKNSFKQLGIYINYNGYGATTDDLHFHPADLFRQLLAYPNPLALIEEPDSLYHQLAKAYHSDMTKAQSAKVLFDSDVAKVVELPNEDWARRVSGVFGNELANSSPDKAHAVVTTNVDDGYTISVRAPLTNKQGADNVCVQFATGGGRAGAAGVNHLPKSQITTFIDTLIKYYSINSI